MKKFVVVSMVLSFLIFLSALSHASTVTYYGCVNNSTGSIKIVSASTTCATGSSKIQWNQAGPTGPKGATGATGPQGPPGLAIGYSATCGGQNITPCPSSLAGTPGTLVLQTVPVNKGTYYVSASTTMEIGGDGSNNFAACYVTTADTAPFTFFTGNSSGLGIQTISSPEFMNVFTAGDSIELWCYGASGTFPINSMLTAIQINQSNP